MSSQLKTEVKRLHTRDYEQHKMLSMIERMHREGRSEKEIEAALHAAGARSPVACRPRSTRRASGRLVRWAARRRA